MTEPTATPSPDDATPRRGPARARLAVGAAAATAVLLAGGIAVAAGAGGTSGTAGSPGASSPDVTVDDDPVSEVTVPGSPDPADQSVDAPEATEVDDHGSDPAAGTVEDDHGQSPAVVPPVAGTPPTAEADDHVGTHEDDATEVDDDHGTNGTPEVDDEGENEAEHHAGTPGTPVPHTGGESSSGRGRSGGDD